MNRALTRRRLIWKEMQQLWPLVASLLAAAVLLAGLLSLVQAVSTQLSLELESSILFGMPGLFAVGAGALLVGQEKERKTLGWLNSLPIAARDIVQTKLVSGILGLICIWLLTIPFALLIGYFSPRAWPWSDKVQGLPWWVLHSFFLLFLGFATAWRMRSSYLSLLVLVPLACLPLALGSLHAWAVEGRTHDTSPYTEIYSLIFAIGFLWLGWHSGLRELGPQSAPTGRAGGATASAPTAWSMPTSRAAPMPALVWQFGIQNRWLLVGLGLLLISAAVGLVIAANAYATNAEAAVVGMVTSLVALLSCSWLGLLVFQSDSLEQRVLFLADRGVQPWKVWCTRQLLPLAIVSCGWLIAYISLRFASQPVLYGLGLVFAIYLTSQWIGQLVDSPIVNAIVAPVLSLASVAYLSYANLQLFAPAWVLILSCLVAFFATFSATGSWMDRRRGWRFWSFHAACICLAVFIPALSFIWFTATYPRLSRAERQQLLAIAGDVRNDWSPPQRMGLPSGWNPTDIQKFDEDGQAATLSQPEFVPLQTQLAAELQSIQDQSAAQPQALPDYGVLRSLLAETLLLRMQCEQMPTPERIANYRSSIRLITEFARRHRAGWQLFEQDQADLLEIWLWEELKQPRAADWIGAEVKAEALALLSDKAARDQARRRAVALSWKYSQHGELGGYALKHAYTPKEMFLAKRKADLISGLLLKLLEATPEQSQRLRSEIGMLINERPQLSGDQTTFLANSSGGRDVLYAELQSRNSMAAHWNGDWERAAAPPK